MAAHSKLLHVQNVNDVAELQNQEWPVFFLCSRKHVDANGYMFQDKRYLVTVFDQPPPKSSNTSYKWKFAASTSSFISETAALCTFCTSGTDNSRDYFVNLKYDTKLKKVWNYLLWEGEKNKKRPLSLAPKLNPAHVRRWRCVCVCVTQTNTQNDSMK